MLIRSRSWPVQSVITLDPRGIIYTKVRPTRGTESMQITFVDHYQVLDSTSGGRDRGFVVPVLCEESPKPRINKVPRESDGSALKNKEFKSIFRRDASESERNVRVIVDVEKSNVESVKCRRCRTRKPKPQKYRPKKVPENENEIRTDSEEVDRFLTAYQIDMLRKNCIRSLHRMRTSSFDANYSLEKETNEKIQKIIDRKLTSDYESVASNETRTTDCDEKFGSRRHYRIGERRSSFHLIRSYSLGHEKTAEKITGTFKKFSLPTPVIQLKEENENPENPQEDRDSALQNLKLDKRKVTTLTRHYYPENGWGYVIVTCSVIVHILCHGLQLAAGVIAIPAAVKFGTEPVHAGKNEF